MRGRSCGQREAALLRRSPHKLAPTRAGPLCPALLSERAAVRAGALPSRASCVPWRGGGSAPCAALSNPAGRAWQRTRERALARQALRENMKNTLIREDAKRGRILMPDRGGEVKKLH